MFEQSFKNIDDILHKDAGCGSEVNYVEQTSWVLFLKYLDDLEKDKENAALLSGEEYTRLIEPTFQWTSWAAPKLADGKIDHNAHLIRGVVCGYRIEEIEDKFEVYKQCRLMEKLIDELAKGRKMEKILRQ